MTRNVATALFAALVLTGAGVSGCGQGLYAESPVVAIPATSPASDPRVSVEVIPPAERVPLVIAGTTADGTPLSTSDLMGDAVVVNAWASWCAPCREELPILADAHRALDGRGVSFLGLHVSDDPVAAADLLGTIPYRSIDDPEGAIIAAIPGVPPRALPSTVILDPQGRLAARVIGPLQPGQLEVLLEQVGP